MKKLRTYVVAALFAAFLIPADFALAVSAGEARAILTDRLVKDCLAVSRLNYAKAFCRCDSTKRIARLTDTEAFTMGVGNADARARVIAKIGTGGDKISLECTASAGFGYCLERNRKVLPAAEADRFCRCMDRAGRQILANLGREDWRARSDKAAKMCRGS